MPLFIVPVPGLHGLRCDDVQGFFPGIGLPILPGPIGGNKATTGGSGVLGTRDINVVPGPCGIVVVGDGPVTVGGFAAEI